MTRVLITGIGVLAPSGLGHKRYWNAILNGPSLIAPITRFDAGPYPCRIGGEVEDALLESNGDSRKQRTASHVTRLALAAAEDCLRDARLSPNDREPQSIAVCVGTALGGWIDGEHQYGVLLERGGRRVNPFLVSGSGNHAPGIEIATAVRAQGPQVTFSSGCPSSLQALGYGANLVGAGAVDICLAGGAESPLSPMVIAALARTQELSTTNDDAPHASRPFDIHHNGMVLSEGSCFLLLESEESAVQRGAHVYAEIVGSMSSCDAHGMYGFDTDGDAGGRAIHRLLQLSDMTPSDLDYICAHANGAPAFDSKETRVLKRALGEFAAGIPVSSIKGVLGHPFGAAGAFQAAAAALAFSHDIIPATQNLVEPAPDCDLDCVAGAPRAMRLRTALVTSYGYGGVNSYLLLRRPA
jgi:3-oxoacyl-(acyl-carrier-protein) synthase